MRISCYSALFLATILQVGLLTGCSLPFPVGGTPKTIYRLDPAVVIDSKSEQSNVRLALRDILSSGYVNSHRILFTRGSGKVGSYQYATWEEFPAKRLTDLLLIKLQNAGIFQSVTRTTSGSVSDYQVNGLLMDFVHEVKAGTVKVMLLTEIVDLASRKILKQKIFELAQPVADNNVDGAIAGFNQASAKLIVEWHDWLVDTLGSESVLISEGESTQESGEDSSEHESEESGEHRK